MNHRNRTTYLAVVLFAGLVPSMAAAQRAAAVGTAKPKTVALEQGSCPRVADGDFITLEWNPAFDAPAMVSGLRNFTLSFERFNSALQSTQRGNGFTLYASPRRPLDETAIVDAHNGFYKIRFQAALRTIAPGEYRLTDAAAVPQIPTEYQGDTPKMTNSPVRSAFCIEVVNTSQ